MKLDVNRYRLSKPGMIQLYKNSREKDKLVKITSICVSVHVPLIAFHVFLLEEFGPDNEIQMSMEKLIDFYKITEVVR